jgi:hypothetical protein
MKKNIAVLFLVFSMVFISCDKDFNTIGGDLVGDEHFDFNKYEVQGLKAYSVRTKEVQTNNLAINPIGIYNNPYFGQTKANFVTQVSISTLQPKFGTNVQVEEVTLYVPYFSKAGTKDADDVTTYTLDSIFGSDPESKIKLSVYENGYFLNSFDANTEFQNSQRYYNDGSSSTGTIDFDNLKRGNDGSGNSVQGGTRLNDSPNAAENDQFFFNKNEIVIYKKKFNTISNSLEYVDANGVVTTDPTKYVVKERLAPGIYLTLNKEYFKKKILDASASNLINNNSFRQFFKGLYFKTEQLAGQEGAMAMLNFNNAKLNLNYSSINEGAAVGAVATSKTFAMTLGTNAAGNTVSLQDYSYSGAYNAGLTASETNPTFGADSNLFLKGGKGSVVYMDVFGGDVLKVEAGQLVSGSNGVPDELDQLRLNGWLINDAYLEFYIDKTAMNAANQVEAERIYLFDATNQKPLADHVFDSSSSSNPKRSKASFGGIIERDATTAKKGVKYKIRITQYITNILNSTNVNVNKNVKLGLCVTENVLLTNNFYYKSPLTFASGPNIEYFPVASILSQEGVVLHGTHPALPADADKRLKLTIHYTKPN